jgi:hypothetical protein
MVRRVNNDAVFGVPGNDSTPADSARIVQPKRLAKVGRDAFESIPSRTSAGQRDVAGDTAMPTIEAPEQRDAGRAELARLKTLATDLAARFEAVSNAEPARAAVFRSTLQRMIATLATT